MLQAGCKADVAAYGALAAAWKDAGEPRECEAVLQKMKAEGLRPNTVIFSTVVQAYGRWGDYSGAFTMAGGGRLLSDSPLHSTAIIVTVQCGF